LQTFGPDFILSATFHQIVAEPVLSLHPLGIFNFHPSILPAYKGTMQQIGQSFTANYEAV
jgi:methionyl-tRNA formyltransferase